MMESTNSTTALTQIVDPVLLHAENGGDTQPDISFSIDSEKFQIEDNCMLETINHCSGPESMKVPLEVQGGEIGSGASDMIEIYDPKLELPLEPVLGLEFESADAARAFYTAYADRIGFRVRNSKSFTSRVDETVIMRRFVCSKQGRPTKKDPFDLTKKRRNRVSSREGCKAMFQVNRRENGRWVVSRCVVEHCHSLGVVQKTSSSILKKFTKKPWELIVGSTVSNSQQNGLGAGGGVVQSLLEYFKRMQVENPAFFYALQVDKNNCVSNVFWADGRARMAYSYFGDAVKFDMSCKANKRLVPFASFTGINHHMQLVVFGCAFMTNESEASFTWLFQTWLALMSGRCPISIVTGLDDVVEAVSEKVLPNVCHRFCKRDIFHKCKVKLADVYSAHPYFKEDFKKLVNKSESMEQFELGWGELLVKYSQESNTWLQQLFNIRKKWVPIYVRCSFYAEMHTVQKLETVHKFFQRHSITTTTLRDIVTQFDKAMASQYDNEVQADSATMCTRPILQTSSPMEKQASDVYTRTIFDVFQGELVGSSAFLVEKIDEGLASRFRLTKAENATVPHIVTYNHSEKIVNCSCYMFEFSGILCRHILRVLLVVGILTIPENYILRRWTRNAKGNLFMYEQNHVLSPDIVKTLTWRCNDLCRDAIRYAEEGATSAIIYKVAKDALEKASAEVYASKKFVCSTWPGIIFGLISWKLKFIRGFQGIWAFIQSSGSINIYKIKWLIMSILINSNRIFENEKT